MKRSHKTLALAEKCKILDMLDNGHSIRVVAEKFSVPKSTVYDIKRKKTKIRQFVSTTYQGSGSRKVMRQGEHPRVEEALYTWFLQQRNLHVPISSEILSEKARFFYKEITGKDDFLASSGWLDKFKKRYGIRHLKICGEKVSSDINAVIPFQEKFLKIVNEMNLSEHQVYNADESAAFWKTLPTSTWVHANEKSAPGRKVSKERITFMPCSNAAGSHKLPLLVIGKSLHPRCFINVELPVEYRASKKGWMTQTIFMEWFRKCFMKDVKKFLKNKHLSQKALLLIDNAPSHPSEDVLNFDENFRVMFLPPNCTAVLQPMDQNLIQNIKVSYRKNLLSHLIQSQNNDLSSTLKRYNLKEAVIHLNESWKAISEKNIKKSWRQLWPKSESDEDEIPLSQMKQQWNCESVHTDLNAIRQMLNSIDPQVSSDQVIDWATGKSEEVANFTDQDIIEKVSHDNDNAMNMTDSDSEFENTASNKVVHKDAIQAFSQCIQWAEENNISMHDVLLLRRLKETASKRFFENTEQQKINEFFKKI